MEAGETIPLLKTADMNQNESAKGSRPLGQMLIYLYFIDFIKKLISNTNWNLRTINIMENSGDLNENLNSGFRASTISYKYNPRAEKF